MSEAEVDLASRVRATVERAIRRGIKGVEYLNTAPPKHPGMPRDLIHQRGTLRLYRYRAVADEVYRVPLLLVMSLVNRPYVFDLAPGQSLIEYLLKAGYEVYLIDWGVPRPEDKRLSLEDYAFDLIPDCVNRVMTDSGEPEVSVLAYCMGGILSVIHAATRRDAALKNLVCLTTPIDWRGMPLFSNWADRRYFDVDRLVNAVGNVPPDVIYASMDLLRPVSKTVARLQLVDNLLNDAYVESYRLFDRWASDQIPFPGEAFRQMIKLIMWDNALAENKLVLGGQKVDLSRIKMSFLHAVAEHDHIAPYASTKALLPLVGSADKEEVVFKGGHVSVVAGPNAVKRLWPKLDAWLSERSI